MAHGRLTAREERKLVIAAERGDEDACRRLVEAFLPAIAGVAVGFQSELFERRELLQVGVAGLLLAARRYDTRLETPFWAYASFWVRKAMQEFVAELARPVSLSDRAVRDLARLRRARGDHQQVHLADPTTEELSRATGLSTAQLESLEASDRAPVALDDRLAGETIVDPSAEQAFQQVLDELEVGFLHDLTDELDERERVVVRAHYGLGEQPQTLTEIGAGLGLTAERARQIEAAALRKLRKRLARTAV
jgi:RNA polymerase sigma factor (sigma-70 family)